MKGELKYFLDVLEQDGVGPYDTGQVLVLDMNSVLLKHRVLLFDEYFMDVEHIHNAFGPVVSGKSKQVNSDELTELEVDLQLWQ